MTHACRICGEQFEPKAWQNRRRNWRCEVCTAVYQKAYRIAHREARKVYIRKWKKDHPEAVKMHYTKWREAHLEAEKAYKKRWRDGKGKDYFREYWRMWRANNRDKSSAHMKVHRAIQAGTLIRLSCENCGKEKTEGHHEDYTQPLVVTWLCSRCHRQLHRHKSNVAIKKN